MRTMLDIDPDVLIAAKELARQKNVRVGKVISELLRQALTGNMGPDTAPAASTTGFEPFPARGVVVSNELIDRLRDAEGI